MRAGLARVEKALRYSEIGNVDKLQVRQKNVPTFGRDCAVGFGYSCYSN